MKFGIQFEFHKIPEWYTEYLDYLKFKSMIKDFKKRIKKGECHKLPGYYYLTANRRAIKMNIYDKLRLKQNKMQRVYGPDSDIEQDRVPQQRGLDFKMKREVSSKDDSYLYGRKNFYIDQMDAVEKEGVENEIADIINHKILNTSQDQSLNSSNSSERAKLKNMNKQNQVRDAVSFGEDCPEDNNQSYLDNQQYLHNKIQQQQQQIKIDFDLPKMDKTIVENLKPNEEEDYLVQAESELEMRKWLERFLDDINEIEIFFLTQYENYLEELQVLKEMYKRKKQVHTFKKQESSKCTLYQDHLKNQKAAQQAQDDKYFDEIQMTQIDFNNLKNGLGQNQSINPQQEIENEKENIRLIKQISSLTQNINQNDNRLNKVHSTVVQKNQFMRIDAQLISFVKDELEYATNWRRAFSDLYIRMKWLNAYAKINYIAIFKIYKKYQKNYFCLKDNIIDKKMTNLIKSYSFADKKLVFNLVNDLIGFYAQYFTKNDVLKSKKQLECHNYEMRRKDALVMSFFCGTLSMIIVMLIALLSIPDSLLDKNEQRSDIQIYSSLYTFRFFFMLIFLMTSAGVVVQVMRKHRINYMYIFELDPQYKITQYQLYKLSIFMLSIWSFCLLGQTFIVKMQFVFDRAIAAFTLAVTCFFVLICLQPFSFFYRRGRVSLLRTVWNIIISPFGLVRFRHFFLADIFCSMVVPFRDLGYITCFFFQGEWLNSTPPNIKTCPRLENYLIFVAFVPYWLRLAQCFRRYHDTKLKAHLWNAGKYSSVLLIQFSNIFRVKYRSDMSIMIFVLVSLLSTIYSYAWDLYMDWGLFRCFDKEKKYLRPKFLYPAWFYYYAMISNFFLRFIWILSLVRTFPDWVYQSQLLVFVSCIGEGFRRAQWAAIRLENENINNFEKYRTLLEIPVVKDEEYER
eukprot:403375494